MNRIKTLMVACMGLLTMSSYAQTNADAVIENIMTRTSVRKYKTQAVEKSKVETLLKAGMAAPTAANKQPWHFVVVTNQETMAKIVRVRSGQALPPLAILVCGDLNKGFQGEGQINWALDASAATENILLAAHALGLGAVWRGVYPTSERVKNVREALKLPETIIPLDVITIGYPDENPTPKNKFKTENISYEVYGGKE